MGIEVYQFIVITNLMHVKSFKIMLTHGEFPMNVSYSYLQTSISEKKCVNCSSFIFFQHSSLSSYLTNNFWAPKCVLGRDST